MTDEPAFTAYKDGHHGWTITGPGYVWVLPDELQFRDRVGVAQAIAETIAAEMSEAWELGRSSAQGARKP